MPERIQAILNKVVAWWKKFNTKQRTLMISAVAVVIVALVILAVVLSRPTKVELVEAESASDASRMCLRITILHMMWTVIWYFMLINQMRLMRLWLWETMVSLLRRIR